MGTFHHKIIGGKNQILCYQPNALLFKIGKRFRHERHIPLLEVVGGEFHFGNMVDVPVFHSLDPLQVIDVIHTLQIHCDPLAAVCDLPGNRLQIDSTRLLEVSKLGDFHPVEPDLPAKPPGAESRRLPVVLDEPDVVPVWVDAEGTEGIEIEIEDIQRGWLHDNLELVIVLKAVRVLAIAAVSRSPGRLYVSHFPRLRPEYPQEGGRVESSGPFFSIIGLLDDTPLSGPVPLQGKDQVLESHFCILLGNNREILFNVKKV